MNTEKTFADRLKELRNIRNYTQEELGKITNISVQSIRRYEQGRPMKSQVRIIFYN